MQNLPLYVYLVFGATVLLACWLFLKAANHPKPLLALLLLWITLQSIAGISGFYSNPATLTTRFPLLVLPNVLLIILVFITKKGRHFIDRLNLPLLTILHMIRIPVEIVLFWLYVHKTIPEALTFHGRNFDIFSGITAPIICYFGFVKKTLNRTAIILWNFICVALLVNVVSNAILALPDRFQKFGFEQPVTAFGFFPFLLLPACLVPMVLFSHLAALRQLFKKSEHSPM